MEEKEVGFCIDVEIPQILTWVFSIAYVNGGGGGGGEVLDSKIGYRCDLCMYRGFGDAFSLF